MVPRNIGLVGKESVLDTWMIHVLDYRVREIREPEEHGNGGAHSGDVKLIPHDGRLPVGNTKPPFLRPKPSGAEHFGSIDMLKGDSERKVILEHPKQGRLICERITFGGNENDGVYKSKFYFEKDGVKTKSENHVTMRMIDNGGHSRTAIIDLDQIKLKGTPKLGGAAILYALADQVGEVKCSFFILNAPEPFASDLQHLEHRKIDNGYKVDGGAFKAFLARRLTSLRTA